MQLCDAKNVLTVRLLHNISLALPFFIHNLAFAFLSWNLTHPVSLLGLLLQPTSCFDWISFAARKETMMENEGRTQPSWMLERGLVSNLPRYHCRKPPLSFPGCPFLVWFREPAVLPCTTFCFCEAEIIHPRLLRRASSGMFSMWPHHSASHFTSSRAVSSQLHPKPKFGWLFVLSTGIRVTVNR